MSTRLDPDLHRDIARFGAVDVDVCMNCGNCTATCELSTEANPFPRRFMHYLQIGNRDRILGSAEPWMCYYCGDCTTSCPRNANPAETMMATRRWLTAEYDWTGLARKLYLSTAWEIAALVAVGAFVVLLFVVFHGPMLTDRVALNTFAPVAWVELGDLVMAAILSFFLLSNAFRMARAILRSHQGQVPLGAYLRAVPEFIVHFTTQKRWRQSGEKPRWLRHFLLVSGYLTMLTLILVFLRWFQTDVVHPFWHPQRLLGYYATGVLLWATGSMMLGRLKKQDEMHRFSHASDWIFLIMLFLTTLTGIVVHAVRIADFPLATYYSYVIHLAVAVPMLVVEVPFGKWAHLLYRPLALYLIRVKQLADEAPADRKVATAA